MAVINFPDSPSDGDTQDVGGITYTYSSSKGYWTAAASSGGGGGGGASVTTGDNPPTSPSQGDLWFDSSVAKTYVYYNDGSSSQWVQLNPSGGSDGADGTDGADATGGGESPVILTEPPTTTQALNNDGTTSTVTMTAQDPEGFDITYGIAYKTTNNARPAQLSADTTINQSTGVFTFTPSTTASDAGSFRARLSASDGVNTTTRLVDFDLNFYPIEESALLGRYEFFDTNSYNPSTSTTALNDSSGNGNNQTIVNPGSLSNGNLSFTANSTSITFTGLNATKAWCIIYGAPTNWSNALMFGTGGSTYYGVFASGSGSNYKSGYSVHSGATVVDRVNGTNPNDNRGTAYSAMDLGSMNSIMNSGTNMATSLAYSQYSSYRPAHEVRAFVFFNRELTLTEMESLHNHYRTNWIAAGGTMPTWGN